MVTVRLRSSLAVGLAGGAAILIGMFYLAAWLSGAAARWSADGAIVMKTNMAVGLALAGAGLILLAVCPPRQAYRRAGLAAGAMIFLIGSLTLSEHILAWNPGIDQLLAREAPGAAGTASPNRMGPPGSTSLTLLGAALLLMGTARRRIVPYLGLIIVVLNLVPAVGFLYGVAEFYAKPQSGIAWPTVLAMICLGLGLVPSHPEAGPMAMLGRNDAGGRLLRGMLPAALLLPLGLGFVRMLGQKQGLYDTSMGAGLFALAMMLLFSVIIWRTGARLSRAEQGQMRAREALRAAHARTSALLEQMSDGFVAFDREWRYTHVNPAAARAIHRTPEQVLGKRLWEVWPGVYDLPVGVQFRQAMEENISLQFETFYPEPLNRWFECRCYPTPDGLAAFFNDITERKAADAALRQSRGDLDRAQAVAQIGSWRLDVRRDVLTWSDENYRIFGVPQGTPLTYEVFLENVHPGDRPFVDAQWRAALRGAPYDLEHRIIVAGEVKWVREKAYLEFDDEGALLGGFGITQDVTGRKAAEEQLRAAKLFAEEARSQAEAASVAKDRFIAVLSHELRTPLAPALAAVAHLHHDERLPDDTRQDLAMVHRNLALEVRLIEDLLDVSRIVTGKLRLEKHPIDVAEVIHHAARIVSGDLDARGQQLELELSGAPYRAVGDAARLQQVFWNLLSNASKFAPQDGSIVLRAAVKAVEYCPLAARVCPVGRGDCPLPEAQCGNGTPCGGNLEVEVIDEGAGIAPGMLDRLFDAFAQDESARPMGGLGLGLAICKAVVEMHGGTIAAHSDGPGRGATFTVRLPIAQCPVAFPAPSPAHSLPGTDWGAEAAGLGVCRPLRILLVEDHADTAMLMRRLLTGQGYEVTVARSVAEGLAAVEADRPDVLISDVGLPDGSGLDLMRTLTARGLQIPAIALSGYGTPADVEQSRAAGFAQHLVKPIHSVRDLTAAIALLGAYRPGNGPALHERN